MSNIKWTNSRKGTLKSQTGDIKIHIRKPFKTALTYGVYLDNNKTATVSDTTIEGCRNLITEVFKGVK